MTSPAAGRASLVILVLLSLAVTAMAAGPVFDPPLDAKTLRGCVTLKASKLNVDGNEDGYISYRIARLDAPRENPPYVVSIIYPFEYTWDTQATSWNPTDPWDATNGSRKYPDGRYELTAVAFDSSGDAVGEPTRIYVRVANDVTNPPADAQGRVLLRPGDHREKTVRYSATGELVAELAPDEVEQMEELVPPPLVEMRMEAQWRVQTRKTFAPGHTADGRRWHGQLDETVVLGPDGRSLVTDWRDVKYGVRDEYIESGHVEMLGWTSEESYDAWRDAGGMHLTSPDSSILDLPGCSGGGGGMGMAMGGEMGGAMMGGGGMPGGGMGPGAGMAGGGMGPGGGMGGEMGGAMMGMAGGAGAGGGGTGLRGSKFMPINLFGLGRKFRSVIMPNGSLEKLRMDDPRYPLAELWTALPSAPVKAGDSWYGDMTILPFFDEEYHLRVHGGGGTASYGADQLQPLFNQFYVGIGPEAENPTYGPPCAPILHVLDGFENYRGYECARIVSRFRNYPDPAQWRRDHKTGWYLHELNPRMFGIGQPAGGSSDTTPMVRTDLTRVTYFAYRSGHIVGMEDHYYHQIWANRAGFLSLAAMNGATDRIIRRNYVAGVSPASSAGTLGLPGATTTAGAAPAAGGMGADMGMGMGMGMGGGMPGGPAGGMGMGMGGEMGGAAATTGGWTVDGRRSVLGAGAGGTAAGGGMGGEMGMGMGMGAGPMGGGMPGGMGGGAMPGGAGMGMGAGMGADAGGMMGGMGAGAGAAGESMCNVIAHVLLRIREDGGSDGTHPREKPQMASIPPVATPATPPGARQTDLDVVKRYVVVEDTGVFYLPTSPELSGQRGVTLETTAQQLMTLGFKPGPDVKF